MVTLYDQFNRPIQRPEKKPDRRPLASAPLTNAFRDYVADGMTPARLAAILKEADAGDLRRQAELFDQLEERDAHIIGEISKRRNVILEADFEVTPASDDAKDVKAAEDVETMLQNITDWSEVLVSLQDAVGKGFSTFEMEWDVSEGGAIVENFKFLEQKRFMFTDGVGVLSDIPRLVTDNDPMGIEIPAFKVMMHRYGGLSGNVVRSGIYRICAWWYLFKNYSIKDWVIFCEVYGMPLRLGKYDQGASTNDINALEIAVRTLGSDAAGVISKATEIEFITGNKGSVSSDLYKDLASFGNKEMSKAILGATLTADSDGKGSYALGNVHNDVRIDLINADTRAIASTVRSQLIRPYVGFNYGWDAAIPKYSGRFKKEDLEGHAEILDKFADRMDIPVSHVRKKYHVPEPQDGEEVLRAKITPVAATLENAPHYIAGLPNKARKQNLDILDMVSARLGGQADKHIREMLKPIEIIMAKSKSLNELKANLVDAYSDMETGALGELIASAMAAADLMGRYEVNTDA
jgi:phage gp29-like protein